jgi:hypothetical protein
MKHLKRYNENVDSSFDINYFNDCFVEFIDNGAETYSGEDFGDASGINRNYYEIFINLPGVSNVNDVWKFKISNTLEGRLKYSEDLV